MKRFWDKVNKTDDCWIWTGSIDRCGYGHIRVEDKIWQAHRYSLVLHGRDPAGYVAMHSCDNPACVNPDHLSLGTQADNMRDMHNKGRYVKPVGKLSDTDVRLVRSSTDTLKNLSKKFDLSISALWAVKRRKYYKDVE
jgi:hypothetical protein